MLAGGGGLLITLIYGLPLIQSGWNGLMVLGILVYSILSIIVGHWLSNLERKGYHGAIWLLMIGVAISIAPVYFGKIPTNLGAAITNIIIAIYLTSKKDEFTEQI